MLVGPVGQEGIDSRDKAEGKEAVTHSSLGVESLCVAFTRTQKRLPVVIEQRWWGGGEEEEVEVWGCGGVVFSPVSPWKH